MVSKQNLKSTETIAKETIEQLKQSSAVIQSFISTLAKILIWSFCPGHADRPDSSIQKSRIGLKCFIGEKNRFKKK